MKKKRFSLFRSIFAKMIFLVIFFGVLLNLSVWLFFRLSTDAKPRKIIPVYIAKMNDYIVQDLGFPPDTLKAKKLSDELNINIRFQSHDFNWTTSANVPMLNELAESDEFKDKFPHWESFMMQYEKRPFYIAKSPKGIFIIAPLTPQDFFNPEKAILIIIFLISFILVILYVLLRWLFSPMKKLTLAVNQIGSGNYDISIPFKRNDEFGELAESITDMAVKIKQNFKSKEQLLIDVSHELRTPLTRIKLGLEVGSAKEKIDEDVREMETMVTDLIETYRSDTAYQKLNPTDTDVIALLRELIHSDGSKRVILKNPDTDLLRMRADPVKIKTLFRNLIANALKYSSDEVEVSVRKQDDSAVISVKDKGAGISQDDLKFIFEPFYRADPSRSRNTGGYGLGLSICKKITDLHGGTIEIKSEINKGTEVIVTLALFR